MIIIDPIEDLFFEMAQEKAKDIGVLNNSITKGEGNLPGTVMEFVFVDVFGGVVSNDFDKDILLNSFKIDMKTKRTTVQPLENYLCSVAAFNIKQECDLYYFARINMKKRIGYLLGGLMKKDFFKVAKFRKEGEEDPDRPGWEFRADCWNIRIDQLKQPQCRALTPLSKRILGY